MPESLKKVGIRGTCGTHFLQVCTEFSIGALSAEYDQDDIITITRPLKLGKIILDNQTIPIKHKEHKATSAKLFHRN